MILFFFKAARPSDLNETYITVEKNVNLHVLIKGHGKDLILIHGLFGSAEMFEDQFENLPEKGFRVIAISLRGFGKSSKPRTIYSYEEYARDLSLIFKKLKVKDATLLGYSMGTAVAVKYLSIYGTHKIKKAILIAAPLPVWVYTQKNKIGFNSKSLIQIFKILFTKRTDIIQSLGEVLVFQKSLQKKIILQLAPFFFEASFYAAARSLSALYQTNLYDSIKNIVIPILLIHGKNDVLCPVNLAYENQKMFPYSQLLIYENSGHGILFEKPKEINRDIEQFAFN